MMGVTPPARELFTHPQILSAGESRINRQSPFTAMITAVVILTLLTVLIATDPDPGAVRPPVNGDQLQ